MSSQIAIKMRKLILSCLVISSVLCSPYQPKKGLFGPRIINGARAAKGQFPWQAAILVTLSNGRTTWCGGSLISDSWILTAGHCVQYATNFKISLGSNALLGSDSDRVVVNSDQFIQHEEFHSRTLDNDVALIKLPQPVKFTKYIQPIDLVQNSVKVNTVVTVSGWGLTSDSSDEPSQFLNYVSLKTISDGQCQDVYGSLPNGAFCAEQTSSIVQSTCEGDSGGPLVIYDNQSSVHVGIVSFGHSDGCESGQPAAFASTYTFRQWIREKTGV